MGDYMYWRFTNSVKPQIKGLILEDLFLLASMVILSMNIKSMRAITEF